MAKKSISRHMNALLPGYQLHWYRIKEILGQGGFGITYLAYDLNLAHEVAIKEYLPIDLSSRDVEDMSVHPISESHAERYEWGLERFLEEARTIGQFKHRNIVHVRNVFEANNTAYMVMDYELGETLQDILNRRKILNEEDLVSVMFPIIDGANMVHAAGYIHRDIKPGNIFIRVDGEPVLLDFGSARQSLEENKQSLTSLFSKGYAPIEQYDNQESEQQGPWTDIYSLGATMYRCISGISPTDAIDRSSAIIHTGKDTYVSALEIGEGRYSKPLLSAIDYALEFKRHDRPPTVSDWQMSFELSSESTDENEIPSPEEDENVSKFLALKSVAEKDEDSKAQCELAYCYAKGIGTEQDDGEAFNWYFNAAENNDVHAQFNLGVLYAKGRGVQQNFTESFHWYQQAATQGDASAQATLGMMCSKGIGVSKDDTKSFDYYFQAASQSHVNAQYTLATLFASGKGTSRDYDLAFKWFQKAAEQGHINAQLNLGFLYGKGKGTERDDALSLEWFEKAAEQGNPNAQYNLGVIYSKGRGTEVNLELSEKWYRKAAEQGDENAKKALERFEQAHLPTDRSTDTG